jgi:hypothetical protein
MDNIEIHDYDVKYDVHKIRLKTLRIWRGRAIAGRMHCPAAGSF